MDLDASNEGYFGDFGGQYVPLNLKREYQKITEEFFKLIKNQDFLQELENLNNTFAGRPSPIYFAKNLSKKYHRNLYFKREDLNHTGAHKINHAIGEALLAKHMGKKKLIAETGAGQHGVAIATAAALLKLECDIYMGSVDMAKQKPNVDRMQLLGARVIPVEEGTKTLKEAVDASFKNYCNEIDTAFYAIGSVTGPHPFPVIVEYFQSIVGKEANAQMKKLTGRLPDHVVACVGGGSNSIGIFDGFIENKEVKLYGVEPEHAASINEGKIGILHGSKCLVLQDDEGNVANAYSVASGLDYPGIGPKHCLLAKLKRVDYVKVTDDEALNAFYETSREEGIIPALESSHAIAYALKMDVKENENILINVSGRGDKDVDFVMNISKSI